MEEYAYLYLPIPGQFDPVFIVEETLEEKEVISCIVIEMDSEEEKCQ